MGQVQSQAALFCHVGKAESLLTGVPWVIQLPDVTPSLSLHVYVYLTLQPTSEQQWQNLAAFIRDPPQLALSLIRRQGRNHREPRCSISKEQQGTEHYWDAFMSLVSA